MAVLEEIDLEDMAAWVLRQKWLGVREDDERFQRREFFPQLIDLYRSERPKELVKEAEDAARRAEWRRLAEQSREAAQRAAEHTQMMRDMREWGRENGHFVGTRGRIPRKVIDAYREAKGL